MKHSLLIIIAIIARFSIIYGQTIDSSFHQPIPIRPAKIYCIKILDDKKILVGGNITYYDSLRVSNLIRLNRDNTLDKSFKFRADPQLIIKEIELLSTGDLIVLANFEKEVDRLGDSCVLFRLGPDGSIKNRIDTLLNCSSVAIQKDDKILVCSDSYYNPGPASQHLYRYNSDFSTDAVFNKRVSTDNHITDIKVYNNSIYICGSFSMVNDTIEKDIVKLKNSGYIDNSFDTGTGTSDHIFSMTIQPDGKVLIGKTFINLFNGKQYHGLLRLNPNGTADSGFNPPALNSTSSEITYRDSSIYLAAHTQTDGPLLLKLNYDGSVNQDFNKVKLDFFSFVDFNLGFTGNTSIFNNSTTTGNKYGLSACDSTGQYINSFSPSISRFGDVTVGNYFNDKLLIAGDFMKVNDVETFGLAMLDKNGLVDKNFILNKNLGSVKQVQIYNDSIVFVSTYDSFLKINSKGTILQNFDFKKYTKLSEIIRFKVLKDRKILAVDANGISRLNPDGTSDLSFDTGTGVNISCTGVDFDLQKDKIIWGSEFTVFNGINVHKLVRLNNDGSLDPTFKIGSDPNGQIFLTKVLASGDMIIGGWFYKFSGVETPLNLIKLSKNGMIDSTFLNNLNSSSLYWFLSPSTTKIEQIDSAIIIKNKNSIICLNQNGTVNSDFKIPVIISNVNDILTDLGNLNKTDGRKSASESKDVNYLFALGFFKTSANSDPSFIIKLNINPKNTLPSLSVSSASLQLKAGENSSSTFSISSNINWNVSSNQNWLTVSKVSGSNNETITVTATANSTIYERTATLTISGPGVPTTTVTVEQMSILTDIPDIIGSHIKLWPVPVKDILHISVSEPDKPMKLEIFFSDGLKHFSSLLNPATSEINMTKFTPGLYFIKLTTADKKIIIRKIIKQ
jgi:uncharacterized delta-60 repeat protein